MQQALIIELYSNPFFFFFFFNLRDTFSFNSISTSYLPFCHTFISETRIPRIPPFVAYPSKLYHSIVQFRKLDEELQRVARRDKQKH